MRAGFRRFIVAVPLLGCGGAAPQSSVPGRDGAATDSARFQDADTTRDVSTPNDAAPANALDAGPGVELTVCMPATLSSHTEDQALGAYTYSCAPCDSSVSWTSCAYPASASYPAYARSASTASRHPMAIDFVVDDMGGTLVFTQDGTGDTVFLHSGEGATTPSKSTQISQYLEENTQANTVHVQWAAGAPTVFGDGQAAGWWTRKSASAVDVVTQLDRPAAVLRWVHDHMVVSGKSLGTVGCSLGTMATLGAVLWKGLDPLVSYQWVGGGSAFWDTNASCGRVPAPYDLGGHCDTDGRPCASHCDCSQGCPPSGGGYTPQQDGDHAWDWCRMPTDVTTPNFAGLINYLTLPAQGSECLVISNPLGPAGLPNPLFDQSSFRTRPPETYILNHVVDFIAQEDGNPAASQIDQKVLEGSTMFVFEAIAAANRAARAPLPEWTDYQPNNHCDHFEGPAELTTVTAQQIISRMSL